MSMINNNNTNHNYNNNNDNIINNNNNSHNIKLKIESHYKKWISTVKSVKNIQLIHFQR